MPKYTQQQVNQALQTYGFNRTATPQDLANAQKYGLNIFKNQGIKQGTYADPNSLTSSTVTIPEFSQADLIKQIVSSLYPQTALPPSFEQSGLYNEADVVAQAKADYDPTFQTEQQRLQNQQQIATRGLGQQQQQQTGSQLSDYYNRGLSRSGALVGAQQYLGQNQALDTRNLLQQQGYDVSEQQQRQRATLADVKAKSYQNAFQRYLAQFNAK